MTRSTELEVLIVDKTTNLQLELKHDVEKNVELTNACSVNSAIELMKRNQPPHIVICVCDFNIHSIGIDAIKMICDTFDDPTEQYLKPYILGIGSDISKENATEAGADSFISRLDTFTIVKFIETFKSGFGLAVRRHYYANYLTVNPKTTRT